MLVMMLMMLINDNENDENWWCQKSAKNGLFLGVSKMSKINNKNSTGEEYHECLERSEGCEGS